MKTILAAILITMAGLANADFNDPANFRGDGEFIDLTNSFVIIKDGVEVDLRYLSKLCISMWRIRPRTSELAGGDGRKLENRQCILLNPWRPDLEGADLPLIEIDGCIAANPPALWTGGECSDPYTVREIHVD